MKDTLKRRVEALSLVFLVMLLTVTMLPTTALAAPKKVPSKVSVIKVSASTSSVKARWKKAKNATSYRIYYRPSTTRKWKALTTVSSKTTSYTHKNSRKYPLKAGKKYYYTVRAYNKYSKEWGKYNTTGKAVTMQKTAHKHNWKTQYKTVTHDAVYENQPVFEDRPIFEERPVFEDKPVYAERYICNGCSASFENVEDIMIHTSDFCGTGYHRGNVQVATEKVQVGAEKVQTGTKQVQTGTNRVKVKDAWTEQVPNGQVCTVCGEYKK